MNSKEANEQEQQAAIEGEMATIDLEEVILTPEDALKCLTDEVNVILPTPNVRACNNLDEYFAKSTSKSPKSQSSRRLATPREPFAVPLVRNFHKILKKASDSQSPTALGLVHKPKKVRPDVFSKVEAIEDTSGPLVLLKKRVDQVVKVLIRRRRKVPYISRTIEYKGTLSLFDKHMNLYLRDVIESFKYTLNGQLLKRARHRDGILIRGDNIILIS